MKVFGLLVVLFGSVALINGVTVKYLHVVSEIQSRFAITDVVSKVVNDNGTAEEITFRATLPDAAFISNFSLYVNFVFLHNRNLCGIPIGEICQIFCFCKVSV